MAMPRRCECDHKDVYTTKTQAARIAKRIRRQTDDRVHEYHCKVHHGWHIGGNHDVRYDD